MSTTEIKELLLWGAGINYAVLCIWFGAFRMAHDRLYRLHTRWFKLSVETFDAIHYAGMATPKIGVLLLNVAPLTALYIAGRYTWRAPYRSGDGLSAHGHTLRAGLAVLLPARESSTLKGNNACRIG